MAANTQSTARDAKRVPRIYVASISDYNAGRLHGVWLEAVDGESVREGVDAMLKASPEGHAEEYAIHDFEGFGSYQPGEFSNLELVCAIGAAVFEHGILFANYIDHVGTPEDSEGIAETFQRFNEAYQGSFESLEDWAEQYLEESGTLSEVPESLRHYIDFEHWAEDAELNGDVFTLESMGKVHVFWHF